MPTDFLDYLQADVHNPRSPRHQRPLTEMVVRSIAEKTAMKELIQQEKICYFAGSKGGRSMRNVDLVFGSPGVGASFDESVGMLLCRPTRIVASGEYKTVMTDHGKNAGNRGDDLANHAWSARRLNPDVYVFVVCIVNAADSYFSPTDKSKKPWHDHTPEGRTCAAKAITTLHSRLQDSRVDLAWTPVIVANNSPDEAHRFAHWLDKSPQPPDGDELAWGHFVDNLTHACVTALR